MRLGGGRRLPPGGDVALITRCPGDFGGCRRVRDGRRAARRGRPSGTGRRRRRYRWGQHAPHRHVHRQDRARCGHSRCGRSLVLGGSATTFRWCPFRSRRERVAFPGGTVPAVDDGPNSRRGSAESAGRRRKAPSKGSWSAAQAPDCAVGAASAMFGVWAGEAGPAVHPRAGCRRAAAWSCLACAPTNVVRGGRAPFPVVPQAGMAPDAAGVSGARPRRPHLPHNESRYQ